MAKDMPKGGSALKRAIRNRLKNASKDNPYRQQQEEQDKEIKMNKPGEKSQADRMGIQKKKKNPTVGRPMD